MLNRTFRFYILDEKRFVESNDTLQNRTLFDISRYTAAGKTRYS